MVSTIRRSAHLARRGGELYRVARGPREYASVTAFVLARLVHRAIRNDHRRETTIRLRGVRYSIAAPVARLAPETFPFTEIYLHHEYDPEPDFVAQPGWVVLDAGANIGVFSVQQAQRGARVIAFEPNPDCLRRLRTTIDANDLQTITLVDSALGAAPGTATLSVDPVDTGGSIVHQAREEIRAFEVRVERLDDVIGRFGIDRIDLLKMDVEGAEADLLRGARRSLELVQRVVFEYHSHALLEQCSDLLEETGFVRRGSRDTSPDRGIGVAYFSRAHSAQLARPPSKLRSCLGT